MPRVSVTFGMRRQNGHILPNISANTGRNFTKLSALVDICTENDYKTEVSFAVAKGTLMVIS